MVLAETDKGRFVVELLPDEPESPWTFVGERWSLLILRDLLRHGPRKFQDFEASLAGVSPNTLSARLKRLEESGIVERHFYEQHPPRAEYAQTGKGRALGPVLMALKKWGDTY